MNTQPSPFQVLSIVHDNGERLPCLVHRESWLPVRLANRWAVRYRRYHVQSSTLRRNLHELSKLYQWAATLLPSGLDDHLLQDHLLTPRHIESFAAFLLNIRRSMQVNTVNFQLMTAENFLVWALYPANRGGTSSRSLNELTAERAHLKLLFQSLLLPFSPSPRQQPLSSDEVDIIRQKLQPQQRSGQWIFPTDSFSQPVALRNWLMIELALQLGLRRGELLKLRLDSLPRGTSDSLTVRRLPDDPTDSRSLEPAVKTAERRLPVSRPLLTALRIYITHPFPLGRRKGTSPYLFVTKQGHPVSIAAADDIVQSLSKITDITSLSWHRFRHTWAEGVAHTLLELPNGLDRLMYLGGWTHPASPRRYIDNALANRASDNLRHYQAALYTSAEVLDG